jgi:Na+/proline symporter
MLGPALVRRFVALDRLTINNEIAGFKFATVGVLYAVLLAFVIIVVWERFTEAELDVVHEAGAAENIYRLSQGLGDRNGADLRNAVAAYLKSAIADDWLAMDSGVPGASNATKQALDAVYAMLSVVNDQGRSSIVSEIFRQLDRMTESRRARLVAAEGSVPNVIWLVLLGGAVVTIAFTFFFGMESLRAQTVMTALLALLIFSELLIVVAIDRPFAGSVKVHPTALAQALGDFESHPEEPR